MIHHRHAPTSIIALALTSALVVGCSPAPEPTPTPTAAFASEEEAFAAAEETFKKYNQALNGIDPADPATFEDLYRLSSGGVEKADRENFSKMHAEGWTITGESQVTSFAGISSRHPYNEVTAEVCLDVSEVQITDATGESAVDPARPDIYPLKVTFRAADDSLLLVDSAIRDEDVSCPAS